MGALTMHTISVSYIHYTITTSTFSFSLPLLPSLSTPFSLSLSLDSLPHPTSFASSLLLPPSLIHTPLSISLMMHLFCPAPVCALCRHSQPAGCDEPSAESLMPALHSAEERWVHRFPPVEQHPRCRRKTEADLCVGWWT